MLRYPGLGLCQKIYPELSLGKLDEHWPFWRFYLLKTRSLIVLQEYEVGGSSSGVQAISRNRLAPLIEIQVKGDVCLCLLISNYLGFLLDGQLLVSKNHN